LSTEVSLRVRALRLLARREYSRAELQAKLAPHADQPGDVEQLLAEFEGKGWLSEKRFVDAVVSTRRSRFGAARVLSELQQKGVSEEGVARAQSLLAEGELEAARAVWQKKFGHLPRDLAERAKQARFLAGRGFSSDIVRRLLGGRDE
jgi:regulatory protein